MKCKLTRLMSNHSELRTDDVVGDCTKPPVIGESFQMTAPPLTSGDLRVIITSPVVAINGASGTDDVKFFTANSVYEWKAL